MVSLLTKIKNVYSNQGVLGILKSGFDYTLNRLFVSATGTPKRKIGVYNGVPVRNLRLSDREDIRQDYEAALVRAIHDSVQSGHKVVVIGGGLGVSTVTAAQEAGVDGSVNSFEGSQLRANIVEETVSMSGVRERVTVRHAIVGEEVNVFLESGESERVPPENIPECDVLVSDCEGAELGILEEIEIRPESIVVETHGIQGSPTDDVESVLKDRGYRIENREPENEAKDVFVLTASLKQ